ncbi:MAG: hypothetical protein ACI8W7_004074 [Gammaproteobacteria bacterium]|jgi:hypothetical protein
MKLGDSATGITVAQQHRPLVERTQALHNVLRHISIVFDHEYTHTRVLFASVAPASPQLQSR